MEVAVPDHGRSPRPARAVRCAAALAALLAGCEPEAPRQAAVPSPAPPTLTPVALAPDLPGAEVVLRFARLNVDGGAALAPEPLALAAPGRALAWERQSANCWPAGYLARAHPFAHLDAAPAMPALTAELRLRGMRRDEVQVHWSVQVTYSRTVNGRTLETDSGLLEDRDEDDDGRWRVAWPDGVLFGGEGRFQWEVRARDGRLLDAGELPFSVRGENPPEAAWSAAIAGDPQWSGWPAGLPDAPERIQAAFAAVVRHESGGRQFNAEPGRGPSIVQGVDQRGRPRDRLLGIRDDYGQFNPNHSSDGAGIGLSQVSWQGLDDRAQAAVTWDWRANLAAGVGVLASKVGPAAAQVQRERRWAALDLGAPVPVPPLPLAGGSVGDDPAQSTVSPELATALKFYNGSTSPRADGVEAGGVVERGDTQARPAVRWDSRRRAWTPSFQTAAPAGGRGPDGIGGSADDPMRVNPYLEKVLQEWEADGRQEPLPEPQRESQQEPRPEPAPEVQP